MSGRGIPGKLGEGGALSINNGALYKASQIAI